jgi:hypothetical protein
LDDVENKLNQGVNDLSEDEQLVVNDTLPDLTGLGFNCIDLVVSQDEHRGEDLVLGFHRDVLRLRFDDVVL